MKFFLMLAFVAGLLPGAALQSVKTVYVFPMRNAYDQYLVNRLTREHVFQVVSDPKKADAVLTDHMGPEFESTFDERVFEKAEKDKDKDKEKSSDRELHASISRAKGTLFLVSRSKEVIWSGYHAPKDNSSKQMERAARRSVDQLKKDLQPQPATPAM